MFKIRITIVLILLFVGGIMLTISGVSDIIKMSGIVPDFNYNSMADLKNGDIVHGDLFFVYDCYAGETTTNTTMGIKTSSYTSREYFIMPLINDEDYDNNLYISISASKEADRNMLYYLSDMTFDYLFDENDDIEWPEDTYIILKAEKLDSELMGYMADWFREMEYFESGENIESHIIPFDLVVYNPSSAYISLVAGIIMLAVPIVVVVILLNRMRSRNATYSEPNFSGYSNDPSGNSGMADPSGSAGYSSGSDGFSESSFAANSDANETNTAASAPSAYIPQPVQPDEFFAGTERTPEPTAEAPKPELVKKSEPVSSVGHSDGIDTSSLNTDKALQEQERYVSSNYDPANDNTYIDTGSLDTDKVLYEQEQAVSSNYDPAGSSNGIDTGSLDTDKALYEQEQAAAANKRTIENNEGINTDTLDTDRVLHEQEQAVSSKYNPVDDNNGIDTTGLDIEGLGYFDKSASSEDEDYVFEFSNDFDPDEIDVSNIKLD